MKQLKHPHVSAFFIQPSSGCDPKSVLIYNKVSENGRSRLLKIFWVTA